jgi:hypothetical protein
MLGSGAAGATSQKTPRADAPALSTKFRDRLRAQEKVKAAAAKKAPARLAAPAPAAPAERSHQFAARGETGAAAKAARPDKGAPWIDAKERHRTAKTAAKVQGFVGRNGTGLGDVNEVESNDNIDSGDFDIVDDLPVNIVGYISEAEDIDYYAITASQGESIRIEVVADRIFNTDLDSYLVVLADDANLTQLASDDDFFDNSRDSFIDFIAPTPGENTYYIGVTDFSGLGGNNFGYVLNITVADLPDVGEVEPNDTTDFADSLSLPADAFGQSDNSDDIDVYVFDGVGEETLIVDVDAEIFLSDMDPVAELYDDRGGFLFGVDDTDGLDPRFNIVLPYTGTFYLAVYNSEPAGGSTFYYSVNVSQQDGALAPRVRSYKIVDGQFLKRVIGSGFVNSGTRSFAEINSVDVRSFPSPKKPTTVVKVSPAQSVVRGDVLTVVNPDGRRSNPGIVQ